MDGAYSTAGCRVKYNGALSRTCSSTCDREEKTICIAVGKYISIIHEHEHVRMHQSNC